MRDSKTTFSPVVIKQEPRDPSDSDGPASPTTTTTITPNNNNNGYSHTNHLPQATAVDLRSSQRDPAMVGRRATSDRLQAYESTEDFVAQIARRVREESSSSLSGLELTPVAGLGALCGDLKSPAGVPIFTGPSSVENGGKSRGEYACGECSSRFDTARDYRAHCLTHQVLKAESMLRTSRAGSREREEREREREREREEEDSPVSAVFGGLGPGGDSVVSFTCEDCNARFSSRDTYAMHMLIRAKNEACFPTPSLTSSSSSSSGPHSTTTPAALSKVAPDCGKEGVTSGLSPAALSGPAGLLLSAVTSSSSSSVLRQLGGGQSGLAKKGAGPGTDTAPRGVGVGVGVEAPLSFLHSLGLDLSHASSYSAAWWSKYMPWMGGMGLVAAGGGGGSSEGEGPALPMVCYLCGELFSNRDSLAMHVLFHTRDLPSALSSESAQHGAWKKPRSLLPSSSSLLPTPSSPASILTPTSTPNALFLGHAAALRQLQQQQQRSHFNGTTTTTTTSNTNNNNSSSSSIPSSNIPEDLRRASLSPTEAVVASAAAAAVAAITPPSTQAPPLGKWLGSRSEVPAFMGREQAGAGGHGQHSSGVPRTGGFTSFLPDTAAAGMEEVVDPLHLSPPQRGASAPIPTSTPTSPPLLPRSSTPFPTSDPKHARPLSADHVALRHHRPLLLPPSLGDADRRHSGEHTSSGLWHSDRAGPKQEGGGWRHGSDISSLQHSSAFNVYRLQRLKKLRLAKGAYRRPGARGRPPMTIFGTASRRSSGSHAPALTPSLPAPSPDPPSPTVPLSPALPAAAASSSSSSCSSSSSSGRISSMVQLLTSQGHVVSACSHCELLFGDKTLYQLHMGLHNVNHPWQCNACGSLCSSRLHFATHTLHY